MKSVLLMFNPNSGLKIYRNVLSTVLSHYADYGYDVLVHYTRFDADDEHTLDVYAYSVDHILIYGGDGTVNYIINLLLKKGYDIPIGVLPGGTANDFARVLGMPVYISKACEKILNGTHHSVDVGRAGDRYFVNIFSMGLYTDTSHKVPTKVKNIFGGLAYYAVGFAETLEFRRMNLKIKSENFEYDGETLILFVMNGRTAGGLRLGRGAAIDDGLLDVIVIKSKNFFQMADTGINLLMNLRDYQSSKDMVYVHCKTLEIDAAENETTDLDGQPGPSLPLHIECVPGAIRVLR